MNQNQNISNVNDLDPLSKIKEYESRIENVSVDEKEDCQSCSWRYWCSGGCPLHASYEFGSSKKKSIYCNILKNLFPEIVYIENLRLKKYYKVQD